MKYTTRPISDRTAFTGEHRPNPFRATWQDTLTLLAYELQQLDAENIVIEIDVQDSDIRLDGMPYAKAKVASPGVRIAFDSKYGPLVYATDRFEGQYYGDPPDWQINVRAIALGLEALRKVDRYGISKRGEQYAGYKALGAGVGVTAMGGMTASDALTHLRLLSGMPVLHHDAEGLKKAYRIARGQVHPDRFEGNREMWDKLEQAARALGLSS